VYLVNCKDEDLMPVRKLRYVVNCGNCCYLPQLRESLPICSAAAAREVLSRPANDVDERPIRNDRGGAPLAVDVHTIWKRSDGVHS
jgi:hypothetical protein